MLEALKWGESGEEEFSLREEHGREDLESESENARGAYWKGAGGGQDATADCCGSC